MVLTLVPFASLSSTPDDALRERLRACAALSIAGERLACFDRTVRDIEAGESHSATRATPEAVFGMNNVASDDELAKEREKLQSISATLSKVDTTADATLLLILENGQVWRALEVSRSVYLEPGDVVTIARGALGSFRLSTGKGRTLKVKRIR